jgi:hypothetical protein
MLFLQGVLYLLSSLFWTIWTGNYYCEREEEVFEEDDKEVLDALYD